MHEPRELSRRVAAFIAAPLFVSLLGCAGSATLESSKDKSQANPLDGSETALLATLNGYRNMHGFTSLAECAALNVSASSHADDMRDGMYLSDVGIDGSTVRTRACAAGYEAGCNSASAMGELVSSGLTDPNAILAQWTGDPKTNTILLNANLVVAGVATSFGAAPPVWAVDMGDASEASCAR